MALIVVLGNLTRDPELREAGSSEVCTLRLAHNTYIRGEKVTQFYEASIWGRRGQTANQHLSKGAGVLVTGQFSTREYEHQGEHRTALEIGNADWEFAGGKGSAGSGSPRDDADTGSRSGAGNSEEIPF